MGLGDDQQKRERARRRAAEHMATWLAKYRAKQIYSLAASMHAKRCADVKELYAFVCEQLVDASHFDFVAAGIYEPTKAASEDPMVLSLTHASKAAPAPEIELPQSIPLWSDHTLASAWFAPEPSAIDDLIAVRITREREQAKALLVVALHPATRQILNQFRASMPNLTSDLLDIVNQIARQVARISPP